MLKSLFSRKQKPPQFDEKWGLYRREGDNGSTFIGIEFGVSGLVPISEFNVVVKFELKQDLSNGWDEISALDERVSQLISKYDGILAATQRFEYHLDIYAYFSQKNVDSNLQVFLQKLIPSQVKVTVKEDPLWEMYSAFLPTPIEDRIRGNMMVVDALRSNGDELVQPRHVVHFAVFKKPKDNEEFSLYFRKLGYNSYEQYTGEMTAFGAMELPGSDEFNQRTIELMEKARSLNGDYDGWECGVVSA